MGALGIIAGFALPLLVVWLIIALVRANRRDPHTEPSRFLPFVSVQDALGQGLAVIALALASIALMVLDMRLGSPLPLHVTVLIGVVGAFALAYLERAPLALVAALAGVETWWGLAMRSWTKASHVETMPIVSGIALLAVLMWFAGRAHESRDDSQRFAFLYWLVGFLVLTALLFGLSSAGGLAGIEDLTRGRSVLSAWQVAVPFGALVVAGGLLGGYALPRRWVGLPETLGLGVVGLTFVALTVAPSLETTSGGGVFFGSPELTTTGIAIGLLLNLLLLLGLTGELFLGYRHRANWEVNLAAALLFLFVVVKYFDWLFRLLDRSIAFTVAGVLFIGIGWLMERARRVVLASMEVDHEHG